MGSHSPNKTCLCKPNMAEEATTLLSELANSERLMIVTLLHEQGEMYVNDIVSTLGANRASLSRHLARLRQHSMVTTRRKHNRIYYTLSHPKVGELIKTLSGVMA